jgi:hypothetical protein
MRPLSRLPALALALFLSLPLARAQDSVPTEVAVVETTRNEQVVIAETRPRDRETVFKPLLKPNPKYEVTKVHEVNTAKYETGGNRALAFERRYWNYGAILANDLHLRTGQFFVVSWVNKDSAGDFTTRFEYRQEKTRDVVRELKLNHAGVSGASRSIFAIVGDAYKKYGAIVSWRFTVWRGDQLVAEEQSFVW